MQYYKIYLFVESNSVTQVDGQLADVEESVFVRKCLLQGHQFD